MLELDVHKMTTLVSSSKAFVQWSKSDTRFWGVVLFLGTLAAYASRVSLPITAAVVSKDFEWSKQETGTVLSSFFWGYATTQVLGGWLADKYSGERLLSYTSIVWAFITLAFPHLITFAYWIGYPLSALTLFRIVMGISQGVHFPCLASITARHLSGAEKGRLLGILMAGSHAGTAFSGSIGSLFLENYGWPSVFYLIGFAGIAWWSYLRYLVRNPRRREKLISIGEAKADPDCADFLININEPPTRQLPMANGIGAEKSSKDKEISIKPLLSTHASVPWMVLFRKTPFWAAIIAHYCGANAFFTLFSWMPTYFAEKYPDAQGWVFNFVPNLAIVITSFLCPSLAARLISKGYSVTSVRKLMEGISQIGVAVMLFSVATLDSYEASLFCLTMALALRGFHHGGVAVNAQDFAPNHAGAVFGFVNTATAIPGFVGVYIAGAVLERWHSWAYVFNLTGFTCLIGATVYSLFGTGKQII